MSQNYDLKICVNGHAHRINTIAVVKSCTTCGDKWAWSLEVDTSGEGMFEPVLEVAKRGKADFCTECKQPKKVVKVTYKIPKDIGVLLVDEEELNVPKKKVKVLDLDSLVKSDTIKEAKDKKNK